MRSILLATDGSPSAASAGQLAAELARATGAELRIVTVWSAVTSASGYFPVGYVPVDADGERQRAEAVLAEAESAARALHVEPSPELRHGAPVQEICDSAGQNGDSLIVMGSHGWGALRRMVMGSVSTGVLHHAPCPVLIVRGEEAGPHPEPALAASTHDEELR